MKNISKIFAVIVASALLLTMIQVRAATGLPAIGEEELTVTYRGTEGDFLVFLVSVNSDSKRKIVNITDENGHELFYQVFYGEQVARKFKIPKGEWQKLTFTIQQQQRNTCSKTFAISTLYVESVKVQEQQ